MRILILNGSPKGSYSITLHTCLYIEKSFPDHSFEVIHVGQQIKKLEKDMHSSLESLKNADLILFSYPVYTFLVPSQLHRFLELVKESGIDLKGKFATQISTSKHFYDTTAHRFIQDNCCDLGMKFIKGLSADMDDLTTTQGQKEAKDFFSYVLYCMEQDLWEVPSVPGASQGGSYARCLDSREKRAGKETVIVADLSDNDESLRSMIEDFQAVYPYGTRIVNIREFPFRGGCISCFHCAADGKCIYKDGFDTFLREQIQKADSIVFAYSLRDHSMGAQFKLYDDRQFCNGHRTVTMGMAMGYLVNGDLTQEENLRTVMEARCEVGHNFYCGAATDTAGIQAMSQRMAYALETGYVQPQNFYGVGGMKIFRDLIYIMRGIMQADHKFYKEHGIYDFPQKQRGRMIAMLLVGKLMNTPSIRSKMGNKINEGMIAPYRKVLDQIKSQS